jgi:SAM-dependent methyltransferase
MSANIVNIDFWNLFQIRRGERILDLGSGNGRHTIEAANWPCEVVSADISSDELRRSRYMFYADYNDGRLPGFAEFTVLDAQFLPYADRSFDKVIATEVLEHVFDDDLAMRELFRVLRPGGEIAVSCPHHRAERLIWWLNWDYWHSPGGHIRIYRQGELVRRLERHGFNVDTTRGRHAYQSIYWTLRCMLGKDNPEHRGTRRFWRFMDWHLERRHPVTESVESALDRVIPKDYVVYGHKPSANT